MYNPNESFLYYDFYNMLRYSTEPMFLKMQGAVLEDFGVGSRHSLYQFMLAQDCFQRAFRTAHFYSSTHLIGCWKLVKRLIWETTTRIINSTQINSFNKWRNDMAHMILAWMLFGETLNFLVNGKRFHTRNRQKNTFQMNIKMAMVRMLNYMKSFMKKYFSFLGQVDKTVVSGPFWLINLATDIVILSYRKIINQSLRTSKYIDPSNKFDLDDQVDIYKVKSGSFSKVFWSNQLWSISHFNSNFLSSVVCKRKIQLILKLANKE